MKDARDIIVNDISKNLTEEVRNLNMLNDNGIQKCQRFFEPPCIAVYMWVRQNMVLCMLEKRGTIYTECKIQTRSRKHRICVWPAAVHFYLMLTAANTETLGVWQFVTTWMTSLCDIILLTSHHYDATYAGRPKMNTPLPSDVPTAWVWSWTCLHVFH